MTSISILITAAGFAVLFFNLIAGVDVFGIPSMQTVSTIGLAVVICGAAVAISSSRMRVTNEEADE